MIPHRQFIEHIARTFGENENTIMLAHRVMREAGVTSGKQGRHSPMRGPHDAAIFLSWIGVTDKPTAAADAVRDFGMSPHWIGKLDGDDPLKALGLGPKHTLIDLLTSLIEAATTTKSLPGYNIEFAPGDLEVAIDFGFTRHRYSREDDPAADVYFAKYGQPYRINRIFPHEFIKVLAAPFAKQAEPGRPTSNRENTDAA